MDAKVALAADSAGNYALLDEFLRDCCLELMTSYGLPASVQAEVESKAPALSSTLAAIDFSGHDLRGTIGMRMTTSVVLETYRVAVGSTIQPGSPEAVDWTCELVNQLVGRLKNKLRTYHVSFDVNTPRLMTSFPAEALERTLRRRFVCEGGRFAGFLDVMIAPGVAFVQSASTEELAEEGDMVLF